MKTIISSSIAALCSFLTLVALAPPELQNQIPQMFPEKHRGSIAMGLAIIAACAKIYQGKNTQTPLKVTPPETTTESVTVKKESVATLPPTETKP